MKRHIIAVTREIWDGICYGIQDPEVWWLTLLSINIVAVLFN